jgi:anti-sigma-K factor RskA
MSTHPQFAEDIDLLALGLLGDEECAALRAHLDECVGCRARYGEARSLAALLAFSAPAAEPPEHVRRQLLAELRAKGGAARPAAEPAIPSVATREHREPHAPATAGVRGAFWHWSNLGWAVATLVILGVTAMLSEQYRRAENDVRNLEAQIATKQAELDRAHAVLDLLHSTDTVRVKLMSGTAPWPWPEGKVYYHPKKGLLFVGSNLPPVESGKAYQLWFVPEEGSPLSAGVFAPDVHGNATLMMPPSMKTKPPKAFAVTLERAGGAPVPTGPEVLTGEEH